jgi:hypothetical protein
MLQCPKDLPSLPYQFVVNEIQYCKLMSIILLTAPKSLQPPYIITYQSSPKQEPVILWVKQNLPSSRDFA